MANSYMKKMLNSYIIKENKGKIRRNASEKNWALLLDVFKERLSDQLLKLFVDGFLSSIW